MLNEMSLAQEKSPVPCDLVVRSENMELRSEEQGSGPRGLEFSVMWHRGSAAKGYILRPAAQKGGCQISK